jgi:hypothetical protein
MVHAVPNELGRAAAQDFARRLVSQWCNTLGNELLGAYLIGSMAHAGFSWRYSDLDMALVTAAGLSPQACERIHREAVVLSADWGPKLSVFWTDRHFSIGLWVPGPRRFRIAAHPRRRRGSSRASEGRGTFAALTEAS